MGDAESWKKGWEEWVVKGGHLPAAVRICQLASKPLDLWVISKRKKIRTTIWEVGRRHHLAKMFQKTQANTETHTNTSMCTHTHTLSEMQWPQDKTINSLL
jgi:hypothetical protein